VTLNSSISYNVVRALLGAFAAASISWAVITFPRFWSESVAFQAAAKIIEGDIYSTEALAAFAEQGAIRNLRSRPLALGALSVIRLRQTEAVLTREPEYVKSELGALRNVITEALANIPGASYQWLALFWTERRLREFDPRSLDTLRMSYSVGPREGWIAVRRNRLALVLYAALTDDLKEAAVSEFINLIKSRFYTDAADILIGSAPQVREIIYAQLERLSDADRQSFAKILSNKAPIDMPLPDSNRALPRPWLR
jgi:hypothetical protein